VAVGLELGPRVGLATVRWAVTVLPFVECRSPELDFFGRELELHLPVRVGKVLLNDVATVRPVRQSRESDRGDPGPERDPYRDEGGEG
jgi:hypothetical protein